MLSVIRKEDDDGIVKFPGLLKLIDDRLNGTVSGEEGQDLVAAKFFDIFDTCFFKEGTPVDRIWFVGVVGFVEVWGTVRRQVRVAILIFQGRGGGAVRRIHREQEEERLELPRCFLNEIKHKVTSDIGDISGDLPMPGSIDIEIYVVIPTIIPENGGPIIVFGTLFTLPFVDIFSNQSGKVTIGL